ncbi:intermembrane phospholipid transport protein YdbH family protein [Marinobacter sp. V034]|uniref:intermembrane phospholipid transport protein YdbH family protein n=1 Tax=Marinobacter sp. V034 TaxID=3459610 RepID=UPI0040440365
MLTRRRTSALLLAIFITVVAAIVLAARHLWLELLQTHNIRQLDWQGLDLSTTSLSMDRFTLRQQQAEREVSAQGVQLILSWSWDGFMPRVDSLSLNGLQVDVRQTAETEDHTTPTSRFQFPDTLPDWLPEQVDVRSFRVTLPCADGTCPLEGSLSASRKPEGLPLALNLALTRHDHYIDINGALDQLDARRLNLTASISIDGNPTLSMNTDYVHADSDAHPHWSGKLDMPNLPRADWLLTWIQQWYPMTIPDLPPQPDAGMVSAQWSFSLPTSGSFTSPQSGTATVKAEIPRPWPLPTIATVQGNVELSLAVDQGQWRVSTGQADVQLEALGDWVLMLPQFLRPKALDVSIRPAEAIPAADGQPTLPLQIAIASRGAAKADIQAHVAIPIEAPWIVYFGQSRLQGAFPQMSAGGWSVSRPKLDLRFTGQADKNTLTLTSAAPSSLTIPELSNAGSDQWPLLKGLAANLRSLQLTANYDTADKTLSSLTLKGPAHLTVAQLEQPQLKPQSWQFDGDVSAQLDGLTANGILKAKSGAQARLDLNAPFAGTITADASTRISGKTGSKVWSKTLNQWPALLDITEGTATLDAHLTQRKNKPLQLKGTLNFENISGIYNRMAWTRLNGPVNVGLSDKHLITRFPALTLESLNPGIPVGPITTGGTYETNTTQLTRGQLTLAPTTSDLLGGTIRLGPGNWDLSAPPIRLPLEAHNLDLSQLMQLYPARNLSGTGTLSGQIPVWLEPEGVHVESGALNAEAPGGRLTLPGDRFQAIAQGNQAMALVAEAMKDFHYSVLDSTIDYDREGTLQLGLHIEGNNPKVSQGQPVVLNINIEENIPALLTSLQLSGRVNDAVTERVKKWLEEQQSAP